MPQMLIACAPLSFYYLHVEHMRLVSALNSNVYGKQRALHLRSQHWQAADSARMP